MSNPSFLSFATKNSGRVRSASVSGRDGWLIPLVLLAIVTIALTLLAIFLELTREREKEGVRLGAIADLKSEQLENWLRERRQDAQFLAISPSLRGLLLDWRQRNDKTARAQLLERLEDARRVYDYEGVYFFDGVQPLLQSAKKEAPVNATLKNALQKTSASDAVAYVGPYDSGDGRIYVDFIAPLTSGGQKTGSAVVLRSDARTFLFPMLRAWPSPSESGESVLVRRDGDRVVFLNDLRHRPGLATRFQVPISGSRLLADQFLTGKAHSGDVIEGVDYRRAPVIGVVRAIEGTDWFLIAKIDLAEVDASAYRDALWIILVGAFALLMIGSAALALRSRQQLREALMERAAQKQASQYARRLIEASLDPLVTISPEGKITDVNEATVQATGVSREKLIGTDFSDYFTEPEKARAGYEQVFEKGLVTDYLLALRHASGKIIDVLYNASLYRDDNGEVIGVFAAARDVTMQRQASQYARSLIEASPDPLVTISPDGKITDVNEATVKATGTPRGQLIGTDFSNYFTEPQLARAGYLQVFAKGIVTDYPLTIRGKGGRLIDVLYNASVYRDVNGRVLGVFAAARDVTAQKQAFQYARRLIEASLDPLVTISAEGKITDVNEATVGATGVSREKLIGTDFSDYFTEPEKARAGYQQVFANGFVTDYPLALRHVSGRVIDVLYNASLYRDHKGEVSGVFAAARDVTELKRAEGELRKHKDHLEHLVIERTADLTMANRELETFAYSVSHDLRAPLRAIDGFSRILLEDYADKLDAEGQRLLNVVREGASKMGHMIDDILSFSRVGRTEMATTPVDMEGLVRAVMKDLEIAGGDRKVDFQLGELPQAYGDGPMIQRVWMNLLDNALKYTGPKAQARIEVGATRGEAETVYFVRDNGVGFDMRYIDKLFGIFQRLHGEEFPGTGIGLAIVRRIIARHGGRVWAEGKPNEGATFYFSLPFGKTDG